MVRTGVEDPAHPAVPQDGHVIDAVRAGDHPRDERGDLQPGVRALVRRHRQILVGQPAKPAPAASATTGTNPAADSRFGSSNTAGPTRRM